MFPTEAGYGPPTTEDSVRRVNTVAAASQFAFRASPLLGRRAWNVYAAFVRSLHLPGDVAECGVFTGDTSAELTRYVEATRSDKTVHMFDSFTGLPPIITAEERACASGHALHEANFASSRRAVTARMGDLSRYKIHAGLFSETFTSFDRRLCFIHADADLYESTRDVIRLADRCLVAGGLVVFDDYENSDFPGVTLAVERHLETSRYRILRDSAFMQCFALKYAIEHS